MDEVSYTADRQQSFDCLQLSEGSMQDNAHSGFGDVAEADQLQSGFRWAKYKASSILCHDSIGKSSRLRR